MTLCDEEDDLSLGDRLIHIDGPWYVSRKYAKLRSKIKNLSLDDMVKVMECVLESVHGDFLTKEEFEIMKLGIISGCMLIDDVEKLFQKRL